jgi:hypothetical protein
MAPSKPGTPDDLGVRNSIASAMMLFDRRITQRRGE